MTVKELAAIAQSLGPVIREHFAAGLKDVSERLSAVERARALPGPAGDRGEKGENGKDGKDGRDGADGIQGAAGQDATVDLDALALKAAALIPTPKDGKDADADAIVARVVAQMAEAIEKAVTERLSAAVGDAVAKAMAAIPAPKDGAPGPAGAAGERGLDGAAGRDGRDGLPGAPGALGEKGIDGVNGKDGAAGKDGRDGTLEHLKVEYDGERTIRFCFKNGDPIEGGAVVMPVVIYKGVFDETKTYQVGDAVTWGGSQWVAKEVTTEKPGTTRAWQLAVKRGADGKQGPTGQPGERGLKGEKGDRGWSQ